MAVIHKFSTTVESKATDFSKIPVKEGQFLIVTDTRKLMYDFGSQRLVLGDIIELDTEDQRTALVTPLSKFYFVKATGALWRYVSGAWQQWADQESVQQHIDQLISSDTGVHGLRYSAESKKLERYNDATKEWELLSTGGGVTPFQYTLTVSEWSDGRQNVEIADLTADQNGVVGLSQDISTVELEAAQTAGMYVCGQGAGYFTVAISGDKPTSDIPITVILFN